MTSTLQSSLNRMILITLGLVSIVTIAFVFGYSEVKQTVSNKSIESTLEKATLPQIDALLSSFLVPEEEQGISILLDKFKKQDELEQIQILKNENEIPVEFSHCLKRFKPKKLNICLHQDRTKIAVLAPIAESEHLFGWLFKVKQIPNPFLNDHFLPMIEASAAMVVISFLVLFLFIGRLTSHEIPSELSNLVLWIEKSIAGEVPTQMPQLKFKELRELGKKITEIMDRHDRIRDQATIGQLTSGIMHDIRTPLHPIVNAMYLAEEQPLDSKKRQIQLEKLLSICCKNIPLIGEMIESTLDANRDIHISPKNEDLKKTLESSIQSLSHMAAQRNVQVESQFIDSVWISHDPTQLGRVFSNIYRNSLEALTPKDSEIRKVTITLEKESRNFVKVAFEDTGPGLPENVENVFRIFRSSKPRGSGLGLVVSRKIVESHQGKLIASKGKTLSGARFEVILPMNGFNMRGEIYDRQSS